MSEASIDNPAEQIAVGSTVINRMLRNNTSRVEDVWGAYAHGQDPTDALRTTTRDLLTGDIPDTTAGATHFYSPRSMPLEGDPIAGYDVGGDLERTPGLPRANYRPSWANTYDPRPVLGVREGYYRFFEPPGAGSVR